MGKRSNEQEDKEKRKEKRHKKDKGSVSSNSSDSSDQETDDVFDDVSLRRTLANLVFLKCEKDEILSVIKRIDEGEVVDLKGLENKAIRKGLEELFSALKLKKKSHKFCLHKKQKQNSASFSKIVQDNLTLLLGQTNQVSPNPVAGPTLPSVGPTLPSVGPTLPSIGPTLPPSIGPTLPPSIGPTLPEKRPHVIGPILPAGLQRSNSNDSNENEEFEEVIHKEEKEEEEEDYDDNQNKKIYSEGLGPAPFAGTDEELKEIEIMGIHQSFKDFEERRTNKPKEGTAKREEWMTSLPTISLSLGFEQKNRYFNQKQAQAAKQDKSWTLTAEERAREEEEKKLKKVVEHTEEVIAHPVRVQPSLRKGESLLELHQKNLREEKKVKRKKGEEVKEPDHPWVPFNREEDLQISKSLGSKDLGKLHNQAAQLNTRFTRGK